TTLIHQRSRLEPRPANNGQVYTRPKGRRGAAGRSVSALESLADASAGLWKGTPQALADALKAIVPPATYERSGWPKSADGVGRAMRRISEDARKQGIEIE